jgi:SM-20-related protein
VTANSLLFNRVPPHHVVKSVFGPEMVESLISYAVSNQDRFEQAVVETGYGQKIVPEFRISSRLGDFGTLRGEFKERMRELLPSLSNEIKATPFELSRLEIELVAHGDGAFYTRHIDTYTGGAAQVGHQRMLSAVYYFHSQPKGFSGGALRLFALRAPAGEEIEFRDIEPENDTLLVFPSWVPHEVRLVNCPSGSFVHSRFAINCWFCRKVES